MQANFRLNVQRYILAILATAAATWGRQILQPVMDDRLPFGFFFLSVLLTAWLAGTGPAVVSLVLGIVAAAHFIILPESSLWIDNPADQFGLLVYAVVGSIAIGLFQSSAKQQLLAQRRVEENYRLSEDLRIADHRKDEFLALLAHELRNPLATVCNSLTLLETSPDADRSQTICLSIRRQLDQLKRIVDDLMDVSRYLNGKMHLEFETLDLSKVAEDAVASIRHIFDEKQQQVSCLLPDAAGVIRGDRVRLMQLVGNLLTNASKYTPPHGRIGVQVDTDGEQVRLSVTDNGVGIGSQDQQRIFELFTQIDTSPTRHQGGLGLGLALVKHLAQLHHGTITVHSRGPGLGSRFSLTLPRMRGADLAPDDRTGGPSTAIESTILSPARVMLVDDNRDSVDALAEILSLQGMHTFVCYDGFAALDEMRRFRPNFVLLDIGLPGMDGYEVARRIRLLSPAMELRIIAITGWGGAEDIRLSEKAGINAHLVKPVDPRDLFSKLREFAAIRAEPVDTCSRGDRLPAA